MNYTQKEETKLLQYADDMTATLSDIKSLQALLDLLGVYEKCIQSDN